MIQTFTGEKRLAKQLAEVLAHRYNQPVHVFNVSTGRYVFTVKGNKL
jgi:hypothetical protein